MSRRRAERGPVTTALIFILSPCLQSEIIATIRLSGCPPDSLHTNRWLVRVYPTQFQHRAIPTLPTSIVKQPRVITIIQFQATQQFNRMQTLKMTLLSWLCYLKHFADDIIMLLFQNVFWLRRFICNFVNCRLLLTSQHLLASLIIHSWW